MKSRQFYKKKSFFPLSNTFFSHKLRLCRTCVLAIIFDPFTAVFYCVLSSIPLNQNSTSRLIMKRRKKIYKRQQEKATERKYNYYNIIGCTCSINMCKRTRTRMLKSLRKTAKTRKQSKSTHESRKLNQKTTSEKKFTSNVSRNNKKSIYIYIIHSITHSTLCERKKCQH